MALAIAAFASDSLTFASAFARLAFAAAAVLAAVCLCSLSSFCSIKLEAAASDAGSPHHYRPRTAPGPVRQPSPGEPNRRRLPPVLLSTSVHPFILTQFPASPMMSPTATTAARLGVRRRCGSHWCKARRRTNPPCTRTQGDADHAIHRCMANGHIRTLAPRSWESATGIGTASERWSEKWRCALLLPREKSIFRRSLPEVCMFRFTLAAASYGDCA